MRRINITIYCSIIALLLSICCCTMCYKIKIYAEEKIDATAKSALLLDFDSGTIIYENQKNKKLPIASMVKLMTIYLTIDCIENEKITIDEKFVISENASGMGGSQVFIDPYVSYSVGDLLKSVIVSSANDSSVALAEGISGSESEFVSLMNTTAKLLGMNNTLYANCTGLPAPEQYSTAEDCAILFKKILNFDLYKKYSAIWTDNLVHPSGRKSELVNTNKLVRYYDGCDGGKTGSTSEAGYCLTATAFKNNMRLISVIIGSKTGKDRFKETTNLFNYGFANFQNKQLVSKSVVLKEVKTIRSKQEFAEIVAKEDFFAFDKKGNESSYQINYEYPDVIKQCKVGEKVGEIIISKNGSVIKVIELTVKNNIDACTFIDNFKDITKNW